MTQKTIELKMKDDNGKKITVTLGMPSIMDAWQLSSAFKKHFDFETIEEVRKEIKKLKALHEQDKIEDLDKAHSIKAYNLSLKIDTCPEYMEACMNIIQRYFQKCTGHLPGDDMKLTVIQRLMEQKWFRRELGYIKMTLFLEVAMVFFSDHLHILPIIEKMMKK